MSRHASGRATLEEEETEMSETTRAFRLEHIALAELAHTDLRREAAGLILADGLPADATAEDIAELLDGTSTEEPFYPPPALAYRLWIDGQAMPADALVATYAGRVGIAWGADAQWGDLRITVDLTTVAGGDAYAAAVQEAIADWLDDAEAWETRA